MEKQVLLTEFVQSPFIESAEFIQVRDIAYKLRAHLDTPDARLRIAEAHQPGRPSANVQAAFGEFARDLGFRSEVKGLFSSYSTSGLRPDYYLALESTGILLEVERGKTTINNMDLLDLWKCHLCEYARYLFLLVPIALTQNVDMRPRNEYVSVCKRLATFFVERNYTNVRGLFIFGY
jgi:hypothetical protein